MRNSLYLKIASIIDEYSTWIHVIDAQQRIEQAMFIDGCSRKMIFRALSLRVYLSRQKYNKGHVWKVSESDLDRTIAVMKKVDLAFRKRVVENSLTILDVEMIINKASFGIINLELSDTQFNIYTI